MRNLKKVLALALATVMLLGMMAMASAAAYKDEAQIDAKYDLAVDIMKAIGVFEGTKVGEDTYLYPTNTLTRAEAAKVIQFIAMTKANATRFTATVSVFEDVPADHWAASAVAYAKQMGIIGGVNAEGTIYDPAGTLTGYQFAKMLLCVLGYKADIQGYSGADWAGNVNYDALNAGLLEGLELDLNGNITRQEAAQMAYNALWAECVRYIGGSTMTVNGTTITVGATLDETGETLQEKLYATLEAGETYKNEFGYNVKDWDYKSADAAVEKEYTVLASYAGTAGALTKGDVYKIFGGTNNKTYDVIVYVNGADTEVATVQATKNSAAAAGLAQYAGAKVEFVKNNDGSKEVIVIVPQLTTVSKVVDATATAARKVELANGKSVETTLYAKNDYVLYFQDGTLAAPEKVMGTLTKTVKNAAGTEVTTLYVDGNAIPVAGNNVDQGDADADHDVNKKYDVLTYNGYAIKVALSAGNKVTTDKLVYVYGGGTKAGEYESSAKTAEVKVFMMDGTKATLKVAASTFAEAGMFEQDEVAGFDGEGFYKIDSYATATGIYTLAAMTDIDPVKADKTVDEYFGGYKVGEFTKNSTTSVKAVEFDGKKAYWTADTKVLTVTKSAAGVYSATVSEVPATATFTADTWVAYIQTDAADTTYEAVMVVTKGAPVVTSTDLYYVVGTELGKTYVAADDKFYGEYNVYEIATGTKSKALIAGDVTTGFKALTKVSENGLYTFVDVDAPATELYGDMTKYGTLVTCGDIEDAEAAEAVIINLTAETTMTLDKMVAADAVTGYAVKAATGNKVVAFVVNGYDAPEA